MVAEVQRMEGLYLPNEDKTMNEMVQSELAKCLADDLYDRMYQESQTPPTKTQLNLMIAGWLLDNNVTLVLKN